MPFGIPYDLLNTILRRVQTFPSRQILRASHALGLSQWCGDYFGAMNAIECCPCSPNRWYLLRVTEELIRRESLDTAWDIANLYLRSIGADVISENAPCIVGLSVDSTCYVSVEYFTDEDPFADYVVHEAAHIFHNVKRRTIGLKENRRCEWLLPIKFQKRETFAYACEVYSRIVALSRRLADRRNLLQELQATLSISDDRVDLAEVVEILSEAIERRNGWKIILDRCS
jgi:hypothetical protein